MQSCAIKLGVGQYSLLSLLAHLGAQEGVHAEQVLSGLPARSLDPKSPPPPPTTTTKLCVLEPWAPP